MTFSGEPPAWKYLGKAGEQSPGAGQRSWVDGKEGFLNEGQLQGGYRPGPFTKPS